MPEEKKEDRGLTIGLAVVGGLVTLAGLIVVYGLLTQAGPPAPPGKANLYGVVTDTITGNPISGALVMLNGLGVYTDAGGNYAFADLDPGDYVLQFSKDGYQTLIY